MEETISLQELLGTLRKRLNLIVSITLAAVTVAAVISYFFITPIYQATTQFIVNKSYHDQMINNSDIQTNLSLIESYREIIKSPRILDIVIEELDLNMSSGALAQKITVENTNNSQVVSLKVQDPDPYLAAEIANKTTEVFQREVVVIFRVDNVQPLAKAEVKENQQPVSPKPLLNIAIAMVVGLMAGVGLAFLLEFLDNTIKTEQDVEQYLDAPV
ncbi:MAG: Wzz/FepE/Etk N-terminal domain-containing protein, partial [Bacillales bacterium]